MVAGRGYVMVCMCFLGLLQQWGPLQHSMTGYDWLVDQMSAVEKLRRWHQ